MDTNERIVKLEENVKSNQHRLDEHDKDIKELKETNAILRNMDYRMGNVENAVDKINTKLDNSSQDKGKKWDKLVDYLFYAFIAVLLGLLYTKLGIN